MSDAPRLASVDQLTSRLRHAALFEHVKPRSLVSLLRDAVQRMNGSGDDAESHYQQALAGLRQTGGAAVDGLARGFNATDQLDFVNRWAIVQLLVDLQDARAVRVLDRIVGLPLPEDRSSDPHDSVAARELVIRTTAVEGIARLAANGSTDARDVLLKYVAHPVRSVRIAAVLALLEQGGERAREDVRRRLAESDHWMLDVRRVHPREVPPIQGHRFLPPKSPPEGTTVPRPLGGGRRSPAAAAPVSHEPPAAETTSASRKAGRKPADSPSKRSRPRTSKKG